MTITVVDLTNVSDTLGGVVNTPFELSDYTDSATIALASGRNEEVGGQIYKVSGGDHTITDSGLADGTVYVLVLDGGSGTATAYLSTKSGTWDPNKGGYYVNDASADDGAKVIFSMEKGTFISGTTVYRKKAKVVPQDIPYLNNGLKTNDFILNTTELGYFNIVDESRTLTGGSLCILKQTPLEFALADINTGKIHYMRLTSSGFTSVGDLTITNLASSTDVTVSALSSTRIAYVDNQNDELRAYDWNGSTWALVGSAFSLTASSLLDLVALSSTRVALTNVTDGKLITYDFDGSNWSLVGNALSVTNPFSLGKLYYNAVCVYTDGYLQKYTFDETDWSTDGNSLAVGLSADSPITGIKTNKIAFVYGNGIEFYTFDGTDWEKQHIYTPIGNAALNISFLDQSMFLIGDPTANKLQVYKSIQPTGEKSNCTLLI